MSVLRHLSVGTALAVAASTVLLAPASGRPSAPQAPETSAASVAGRPRRRPRS